MEPLRPDDPRRLGPYDVVARLDADGDRIPVPERRFIARLPGGNRTVLISLPLPGTDPARFAAEATAARQRPPHPWLAPVTEAGGTAEAPWYASPYLPALPLTAALAAHQGPLPEHTVGALGAALVEALAALHATGVTHAGLSPAAVLITAGGPLLTCFGAVRAAAPDGEQRSGLPGLASGSVAPEQLTGGRPRPPGDIYALGSVLAYAATGHLVPPGTPAQVGWCGPGTCPENIWISSIWTLANLRPTGNTSTSGPGKSMRSGSPTETGYGNSVKAEPRATSRRASVRTADRRSRTARCTWPRGPADLSP
ncbi:serine-threonine protein kinase [Streptomyces sparsogenes DSM 40356]|uniref:Serine-threonine protein kinase n=1 Tax=Streptomyces sparsogenes DSM 40356 TaxID=1331668 RepID=A0A1R1SR36_9ACTN|nr:serine-threonine protein kinase [Streptomyces sparsogenes DSM 40356]